MPYPQLHSVEIHASPPCHMEEHGGLLQWAKRIKVVELINDTIMFLTCTCQKICDCFGITWEADCNPNGGTVYHALTQGIFHNGSL